MLLCLFTKFIVGLNNFLQLYSFKNLKFLKIGLIFIVVEDEVTNLLERRCFELSIEAADAQDLRAAGT
jgi:hypothetical protein